MKSGSVALLIGAVILFAFSVVVITDRVRVLASSDIYSAVVIQCDNKTSKSYQRRSRPHGKRKTYAPVAVSKEGFKAVGSLWISSKSICEGMIGRETSILVNRKNPEKTRLHSFFQFWFFPSIILLFVGFAMACLWRKTKLAIAVFAGFFALTGVATVVEFGLFREAVSLPKAPLINAELALNACIKLAMRKENVDAHEALKELTCQDRGLTDLSALVRLTGLEKLDVSGNNVVSLSALNVHHRLRVLTLTGNKQLESLDGLDSMQQLEELTVHCAGLNDIDAIAGLNGLRHLDISCNNLSNLSVLENLKQLERLEIGDNREVTDISSLANKPLLEVVGMYGTAVGDISPLFDSDKLRSVNIGSSGNVPCRQIHELRARLSANARVRGPKACDVK